MQGYNALRSICMLTACMLLHIPHLQAAQWEVMDSGTRRDLHGITGFDVDNIYAVGTSGTILHYGGSSWSPQASGTA